MRTWKVSDLRDAGSGIITIEVDGVYMATAHPDVAQFIVEACNEKEQADEDHVIDAVRYASLDMLAPPTRWLKHR